MNGRIYDPRIGRFLTADPVIDGVFSTQGMNRYSYVGNNPLAYTDPDGLFKFKSLFKAIFVIAAVATLQFEVLPVAFAQAGMAAATIPLASAVTAGAIGGLISGGDLQGMLVGAVSAELFYGAGEVLGHGNPEAFSLKHFAKTAAHAAIGCATSEASGGRCAPGAMAAGFASFAGPIVPDMKAVGNGVARAVIGGIAAKLGGGKFENGAVTAAFGYLFNDVALACRSVGGTPANHCGLFVYQGDRETAEIERQYSMQGFATEFDSQHIGQGQQRSKTYQDDFDAFRTSPGDRIIIIQPPEGMSQRNFEESIIRYGDNYKANSYCLFGQMCPNSNSAAAYPIYRSGGNVPTVPFWAPGLRYYAP